MHYINNLINHEHIVLWPNRMWIIKFIIESDMDFETICITITPQNYKTPYCAMSCWPGAPFTNMV